MNFAVRWFEIDLGYRQPPFLRSLKSFIRYGSFPKDYFNVTIVFTMGLLSHMHVPSEH